MFASPRREATQRYWAASRAWRGFETESWNVGRLIQELSTLAHFKGMLGEVAANDLDEVINDQRRYNQCSASVESLPMNAQTLHLMQA